MLINKLKVFTVRTLALFVTNDVAVLTGLVVLYVLFFTLYF